MRTNVLPALIAVAIAVTIAGCGGGGEQIAPPPQNTTSIEGQVDVQGSVAEYDLLLDGQPVPGALTADGNYTIENVTPGEHRVAVVSRDGMEGGYATVQVRDGERARAPRIVPELGGQIVGIVTVVEDGVMRALEGVEITAQPAIMLLDRPAQGGPDADRPVIYPPPDDLPSFSTFTDADGSFMVRAVPQGEYTVSVAEPSMEGTWQWVWVEAGHTAVADFTLRPVIEPGIGTVRGRVLATQGGLTAPAMGARVTITSDTWWGPIGPPEVPPEPPLPMNDSEGGRSGAGAPPAPDADAIAPPYYNSVSTLTNQNGEYELNAPSGYASIEVYMPGWAPVWEQIRIMPGETLTRSFELEDIEDWTEPPPPPGIDDEEPPAPPELPGDEPPAPPFNAAG